MLIQDDEKPARKAALDSLKAMLSGHMSKKLEGLKKPAVAIEVEKEEPVEEDAEPSEDVDADEPSAEDKARIVELYNKYCK